MHPPPPQVGSGDSGQHAPSSVCASVSEIGSVVDVSRVFPAGGDKDFF